MKLCNEINHILHVRQANASSKKQKKLCPECGTQLPIYSGRYPFECPGCKHEFDKEIK